ncbi:MAG: hypothetical protein HYX69_02905 [Planctomycetia bacterium]|nr:hypothetical protein [Planctomycetia bacterium]
MNAWLKVSAHPSADEFRGYYNIPDQCDDGTRVLRSVDRVPAFGFPEMWEVYQVAKKWFAEIAPVSAATEFDPLAVEPFYVRDETDDRTLCVDADFKVLNTSLLRRVQREFLGQFPLWRIALIGEHSSHAIMIYPTVIRFGNLPVELSPDEALRQLVPRALALREARERPRREKLSYLRQRLPDAVRAMRDRPFLVLGVLDNYDGDQSRLTICLLVRGADPDAVGVNGPAECSDDFLWSASAYGVSAEGRIVCEGRIPETTPFCLHLWLPPADYRGALTIVERDSGTPHSYGLKPENIVHIWPDG